MKKLIATSVSIMILALVVFAQLPQPYAVYCAEDYCYAPIVYYHEDGQIIEGGNNML